MTSERLPAVTSVTIGGQSYPYRTVANCSVCQSPHRDYIEHSILGGFSYTKIAEAVSEMSPGPMAHPKGPSIATHVTRNHMPMVSTAERALIEQRARDIGRDIDGYVGSLVDYQTVNQIVIQKGMARIVNGEIEPSMADLLAAIRNQHSIEQTSGGGLDVQAMQDALLAYLEVAKDFIPAERMSEYGRELMKHPILKAMYLKSNTTDGEAVEE